MNDTVTRLRQTRANMIGTEDEQHYFDCQEAAGEIERLRGDLEVRRLQLDAAAGEVQKLRSRLRLADAAIRSESPTLTDAEREAIAMAYSRLTAIPHYEAVSATLRGLLERLG
jgi:hypothetical protein